MYYRKEALEAIARGVLSGYRPHYMNRKPAPVPIEEIIEHYCNLTIDYVRLTYDGRELGRMIYDNGYTTYFNTQKDDYGFLPVKRGTMLIDENLLNPKQEGRLRFTLAHELAHWLLHDNYFTGTGTAPLLQMHDTYGAENKLEWQANHLASYLLMPAAQIKRTFYASKAKHLNDQFCIDELTHMFNVSRVSMEIRLAELHLT